MKMKKYLACLLAAMMMCGSFTACGGDKEESKAESAGESAAESEDDSSAEADEAATEAPTAAEVEEVTQAETEPLDIEPVVDAQSGQAYLAIAEEQVWVQYWGSSTDSGYMLAYDAGVCTIDGNGSYTVSVNAGTNGFRADAGEYTPSGLKFAAIIIKDGSQTCPDAVITIDSILVDGEEIEMTAKNYTSSDDGVELRSNIYNGYMAATDLSGDAHSAEGPLFDADGNKLDIADAYSPHVVDPADFGAWTTVEVNFTVSGMGEDSGAAEGEESAAEGEESAAEEETAAEEAAE